MIEPVTRLALALHSNPGAYALLVGAGLSDAAGVPTGWGVALDLAERVAAARGADTGSDAAAWFERTFTKSLSYTDVLAELSRTPAERMALLQRYFEPTDEERAAGLKRPTRAHRAIADLVSDGYLRVIVTTNFDRLIETALREISIEPTVISSGDAVAGSPPPGQARCLVIKVHGDYLDARLRNTPDEVANLDAEIEQLVRRVFDEHGLVVVGWSAKWDTGLNGIVAAPTTDRYATYWAARRELDGVAAATASARAATVVRIRDADSFLGELRGQVQALADLAGQTAITPRIAVARAKRLLPRPEEAIALHDFVLDEVERVRQRTGELGLAVTGPETPEVIRERLTALEAGCAVLLPLIGSVAYWATGPNAALPAAGIERLAESGMGSGSVRWLTLQRYPAILALYAAGTAAVAAQHWDTLRLLFERVVVANGKPELAARALAAPAQLEKSDFQAVATLDKGDPTKYYTPISDRLCSLLRTALADLVPDERPFLAAFDRFEVLLAMRYWLVPEEYGVPWPPIGSFSWRHRRNRMGGGVPGDIEAELKAQKDAWPPISAGVFASDADATEALAAVIDAANKATSF